MLHDPLLGISASPSAVPDIWFLFHDMCEWERKSIAVSFSVPSMHLTAVKLKTFLNLEMKAAGGARLKHFKLLSASSNLLLANKPLMMCSM